MIQILLSHSVSAGKKCFVSDASRSHNNINVHSKSFCQTKISQKIPESSLSGHCEVRWTWLNHPCAL